MAPPADRATPSPVPSVVAGARQAPRTRLEVEGVLAGTPLGADLAAVLDDLQDTPVRAWPAALPPLDLPTLAGHLRFSGPSYTRVLLAATPRAEALLMGWLPGQESRIHDHGASHGVAFVLAGGGVEDAYRLEGERLRPAGTRAFSQGDILFESPGDVHRVRHPGPGLLVTLHAYAPRLKEFRTYDAP